ncbi:STN domain-containing protein, partial [Bowmanella yangjiangensis]
MQSPRSTRSALRSAIRNALFCSGLALGAALPALARADSAHTQAYQISAGPLAEVLGRFASAAGVALSFDAALLQGRQSQGLQGQYGVEDGFARLLQGSGLQAVRQAEGVYGLTPQPQAAVASPAPSRVAGDVLRLQDTEVTVSTLRGDTAVGQTSQRVTVID